MATKPEPKVEEPENTDSAKVAAENRDNGAGAGRKPSVRKEPKASFDERTGVGTPPWLNEDGTQNTGVAA